jgi:hypothetical protein
MGLSNAGPDPETEPTCVVEPVVSGSAVQGSTLTCAPGSWTGTAPIVFTYQWKRDGVSIAAATNSTYVTVSADFAKEVTCVVVGTNTQGADSGTSNGITVTRAPANTVAPALSGTHNVGQTMTCSTGTWTGTAVISYTYQWKRDGVAIGGETASTYVLTSSDLAPASIKCTVTATNGVGSASADSNAITDVAAAVMTWDTAYTGALYTYSNGNKTAQTNNAQYNARSLTGKSSGVWDITIRKDATGNEHVVGIQRSTRVATTYYPGQAAAEENGIGLYQTVIFKNTAGTDTPLVGLTNNTQQDVRIRLDADNGTVQFFVDGVAAQASPIAITGWSAGWVIHAAMGVGANVTPTCTFTTDWVSVP